MNNHSYLFVLIGGILITTLTIPPLPEKHPLFAFQTTDSLEQMLNLLEYSVEHSPPQAYPLLHRVEQLIAKSNNPDLRRQFLFIKGKYLDLTGRYHQALQIYLQCATLAETHGAEKDYLRAMNNVAVMYARVGQYTQSQQQYRKLLKRATQIGDQQRILITYVNMANNFLFLHQPDSAEAYYRRALPITQEGSFYRAAIFINLARLYNQLGNYPLAQTYARYSAAYADSVGNREMYLESLANIVNSYRHLSRWHDALTTALHMEQIARQHQLRAQLKDIYQTLGTIYESLKQWSQALMYYRKYMALKDSLMDEKVQHQLNTLQLKYESEQKERALVAKEKELQRTRWYLLSVSTGSMVIAILGGILFWLYRRQRQAYRLLVQKHLQFHGDGTVHFRKRLPLNARTRTKILKQLENQFIQEKWYLQPDVSLEKVATALQTNSRYLSEVIREAYQTTFPNFVNQLRVQEAIQLFKEDTDRRYSIEGIAQRVGFKSKSAFNSAFKKFTGVTPSFFRKELHQQQNSENA